MMESGDIMKSKRHVRCAIAAAVCVTAAVSLSGCALLKRISLRICQPEEETESGYEVPDWMLESFVYPSDECLRFPIGP